MIFRKKKSMCIHFNAFSLSLLRELFKRGGTVTVNQNPHENNILDVKCLIKILKANVIPSKKICSLFLKVHFHCYCAWIKFPF